MSLKKVTCAALGVGFIGATQVELMHGADPSQLHFPPAGANLVFSTAASTTTVTIINDTLVTYGSIHEAEYVGPAKTDALRLNDVTTPRPGRVKSI